MFLRRPGARLSAFPATLVAVTVAGVVAAAPASAHVTGKPSDASAGAFTVLTMSIPHGCEESPTTKVEIQVPESVLSVTPTRNAFWDVDTTIAQLDDPVADAHGNMVTERTATVVYTANTPLPDGQRDTFELSFQVPDTAGETLAFPTVQTCEEGETGWVEVPEAGQDAEELEHPAPSFEILPAVEGGDHGATGSDTSAEEAAAGDTSGSGTLEAAASTEESDPGALGWAGLVAGLLGLVAGGTALLRSRKTT